MPLRLLGKCPDCGIEDKIVRLPYDKDFSNYNKVQCENCKIIWDDWLNLTFAEKDKNNRLIPVEVERRENYVVKLTWPSKREVPYNGLIATVLNSALITKFSLDVCLATEGGLTRRTRDGFELRNCYNELGLYTEYGEDNAKTTFDFYEKMMRQLFEEPLSFGNVKFRRGEILWLEDEDNYSNALVYLFGTLTKTQGKKFAEKVLKKKEEIARNPFSAPYIRGLTNEEIAKFFVPPPIN